MKEYLKNKNISIFFAILLILVLSLIISYVFTGNVIIKTSTNDMFYSVDEDINFTYNVKIDNINLLPNSNITKVNISLPDTFYFLSGTNGTDYPSNIFSKVGNNLIWSGDGLIMNLSTQSFWFDSFVSTPGNYNLTIATTNFTGVYLSYMPVIIKDLTVPQSIEFIYPTESNSTNLTTSYIPINVSAEDNGIIDTITINLFNSSNKLIESFTTLNSSAFVNFTGLPNGIYHFNSTVNDSYGNFNSTKTRFVTISFQSDTIMPVITLINPSDLVSEINDSYDFVFRVLDSSSINNCTLIFDGNKIDTILIVNNTGGINTLSGSSFDISSHVWNISCVDSFGNIGKSKSRTLIVKIQNKNITIEPVTAITNIQPTEVINTSKITNNILISKNKYLNSGNYPSKEDLINGYENIMNKKENLTFDIENESHSLNIKNISKKSVRIILSSTPQEATFLLGEEKKFDLSEDGYYDLFVKLNFIYYLNESEKKANFTIKAIHEKINEIGLSDNVKDNNIEMDNGLLMLIIFASIIVILIFTALILKILKLYKNRKIKGKRKTNK